jgi:glycine cleavage system regulatory protein
MKTTLVLTLIGPDRPGLVEVLAAAVADHDGNWEQGRMTHLAGQFAGILQVSVPEARAEALRNALAGLSEVGLRVVSEATLGADAARSRRTFHLEVMGNDRPGIVRALAAALSARSVNVEQFESVCEEAPMTGGMLFCANAVLHVPDQLDIDELRSALEALGDDLMVDVALLAPEEAKGRSAI